MAECHIDLGIQDETQYDTQDDTQVDTQDDAQDMMTLRTRWHFGWCLNNIYSFYLKFIATYAPAILGFDNSVLVRVQNKSLPIGQKLNDFFVHDAKEDSALQW